ncbi:MAG: hypothetical protein JWN15_323 [Firmicutes bacterium]|nr:hypothetical protein [Bacillota bacterium]
MITCLFVALSLAFVAGAVAFKTSAVTSSAGATVTTTSTAALSVEAVDPIGSYVNNALRLNFLNQQPDSTYTYTSAFRVTNRTAQSRTVSVAAVTGESTPGVHLTIGKVSPAATLWQNGSGVASVTLTANQAVDFNVMVTVDQGATLSGANPMSITLNGQ